MDRVQRVAREAEQIRIVAGFGWTAQYSAIERRTSSDALRTARAWRASLTPRAIAPPMASRSRFSIGVPPNAEYAKAGGLQPIGGSCQGGLSKMSWRGRRTSMC